MINYEKEIVEVKKYKGLIKSIDEKVPNLTPYGSGKKYKQCCGK